MNILHDMFQPDISVLEKVLRPVVVYIFLVVCLRLFGKRQLAQLNPFDLVVLLSISNTVQNAIIGNDNSVTGGLIGALSLFGINYLVVRYVFRHRTLDQILEGEPSVLMENGTIVRSALAKELLSEAELEIVAHRQGYASLKDIDRCVLEPGGVIYMRPKEEAAKVKPAELMAKLNEIAGTVEQINRRLGGGTGE